MCVLEERHCQFCAKIYAHHYNLEKERLEYDLSRKGEDEEEERILRLELEATVSVPKLIFYLFARLVQH